MTFRRVVLATVRFLFDWRTGLMVLATALVALTIVVVLSGAETTRDALHTRDATASSASRRIDLLTAEIRNLEGDAVANGARIGELEAQVAALQQQVRQQGGRPVVAETTTTVRPRPSSTTSTTQPPASTTTTTTTRCRANVAGNCIGGRP